MSKTIYIGGRLESKEKGNVVTGANAILDDTKGKKQNVINKETDDELLRLEQSKQDNLNFDNAPTENSTNPVTSGGVYTAEKALSDAIEAILLLIPSAATALNKLVDTNTMNSSISTATATFRGTYNAVSDLGLTYQATHAQIEAALDALGLTADNNDFVFVQIPVSDQSQDIAKTERFKFNGTNWLFEYDLNTSGYTAAQWAAINSGITVALVTKLTDLPTAADLQLALNAKQDTLTFDDEPTVLSQNPVTSGGIYTAIQAVATALSDYSTTTDGRLNVLEGLVPTEASSINKLTDKAYVDGLIQAITELIPTEADTTNQLADKAYVLVQILAATPAFKGQFTTLAELQAVASPKAGDLGIVRTKDSDGMDVFTVYQYLNNAWNVFYSLSYHPQTKPATTGTTGDYPYNGMGRVELAKNMVNTGTDLAPVMVNQLTQDMFYKGAVGSRVPNTNTIFVIRYDYILAENITIPDGCVLEFDGGSLSGAYTLTGVNTGINAGLVKIFNTDVTLAGTWNVTEAYPEWFGAKGDGITDDSSPIQKVINYFKNVKFTKHYIVNSTILLSGVNNCTITGTEKSLIESTDINTIFYALGSSQVTFNGLNLDGNRQDDRNYTWPLQENAAIIINSHSNNNVIENCRVSNFNYGICLGTDHCSNNTIRNNIFTNNNSDIDTYGTPVIVENNISRGCTGNSIQIESLTLNQDIEDYTDYADSPISVATRVANNTIMDCIGTGIVIFEGGYSTQVINNTIINYQAYGILIKADTYGTTVSGNIIKNFAGEESTAADSRAIDESSAILSYGNDCKIDNNLIIGAQNGLRVQNATCYCKNNTIINSLHCGIATSNGRFTSNFIKDAGCSNNGWWGNNGVYVNQSNSNIIFDDLTVIATSKSVKKLHNFVIENAGSTPVIINNSHFEGYTSSAVSGNAVITNPKRMFGVGTTRPTLTAADEGFAFFDKNNGVKKPIWWNGTDWIDATGTPV